MVPDGAYGRLQSKKEPSRPFECFVWHAVPLAQHAVPSQQRPPHARGAVPGQAHVPDEQICSPLQAWSQLPQCRESVASTLQAAPQQAAPVAQGEPHAPLVPPQCCSLVWRSKQPSPQSVSAPEAQAQAAPLQRVFPGSVQAAPQVPQFSGSSWRSVHVSGQVAGAGAKQPHAPPSQLDRGTVHAFPHAPQCAPSRERSRHQGHGSEGQCSPTPVHEQVPPLHVPRPQSWPHPPQFAASAETSAQAPAQQVWLAAHATPQAPQFARSELAATHRPPHSSSGTRQLGPGSRHPATSTRAARAAVASGRSVMLDDTAPAVRLHPAPAATRRARRPFAERRPGAC